MVKIILSVIFVLAVIYVVPFFRLYHSLANALTNEVDTVICLNHFKGNLRIQKPS